MKVLIINSHPIYHDSKNHTTNRIADFLCENLKKAGIEPEILNLCDKSNEIPRLDEDFLNVFLKEARDLNPKEEKLYNIQNKLIDQWIEADFVFILSPLYNYNITSHLKDYFDNLMLANKTFEYQGSDLVGILDPNKKVVYIQIAGSDFSRDLKYVAADISSFYIRTVLNFMGIRDMDYINIDGLDIIENNKEKLIKNGEEKIVKYINDNIL